MIITKLQGGLGNQLFQWAYGKYLSKKYNTSLYLDIDYYMNFNHVDTKRSFSLDLFPNLNHQILNDNSISVMTLYDNFIFTELNYNNNYNYYLNGYWQSEKYFIEIEDIIRFELSPTFETLEKLKKNYPIENSVSMHIRRTDYVTSNGYHPVQSIDYYKNALDLIGNYDNIIVFSDDINWCKENLQFKNILFIEGNSDVEDLWLMSLCKNNIIANSSFSWWGAWLNNNKNKKIIYPSMWFCKQANLNTSHLIPNSWIKLNSL